MFVAEKFNWVAGCVAGPRHVVPLSAPQLRPAAGREIGSHGGRNDGKL